MVDTALQSTHAYKEITVRENEHLVYEIVHNNESIHDSILYRFICKRNSVLKLIFLLMGTRSSTIRCEIVLQDVGAQATILGCCALTGFAHQTIEIVQQHDAPHTNSYSLVHAAVTDHASFKYDGKIIVAEHAHATDAALYNKNLLLSNTARAVALPSLEVHTNRVQCKHGTATGRCDREQLLYMQSRGIEASKAKELLLRSFFSCGFDWDSNQVDNVMQHMLK